MELVPSVGENPPFWGLRPDYGREKEPALSRDGEWGWGVEFLGYRFSLSLVGCLQLQLLGSKTSAENPGKTRSLN